LQFTSILGIPDGEVLTKEKGAMRKNVPLDYGRTDSVPIVSAQEQVTRWKKVSVNSS
jgi:hypothetical protein